MRNLKRSLLTAAGATLLAVVAMPVMAHAQYPSQRGQPRTPFGATDFARLHWLEGDWAGTAPDESPLFVRCKFTSDSTAEITYYRDAAFAQASGSSRLYLSVGRVYHSFGPNRWGASHIGADGVVFVPQVSTRSNLQWDYVSADEWKATQRSGVGGHEHVTVYDLKRVR
ncbi:MAG TPA: hypothetical protein VH277_20425 [Gemmatimonadaceae bacterium]|nr:hypothetical protein [Gemmatimonadaceae bacterium]